MLRIAFRLPANEKEKVLDALMPLLPTGIREEALEDGSVELASVGTAATLPSRKALEAAAGRTLEGFETGQVPADWRARRARYGGGSYVLGGRLVVRSPWDPPAPAGMLEVVIERTGNAFGSGSHPTTQMCLSLLLDVPVGEGGAADLGCGIGTLGIAAARLGWSPVAALDRVEVAVEAARANALRNEVELECAVADLESEGYPARELLLVNAPPPVHEKVAASLVPEVRQVIVSGIVGTEVGPVRDFYAAAGLHPAAGFEDDAWAALRFERRT
jgi:ribosomal protein L11 methyltransferase